MSISKRFFSGWFFVGASAAAIIAFVPGRALAEGGEHGGHHGKFFQEKFEDSDSNKDGKLTWDEFKSAHEKRLKNRFERLDQNGDGSVTKDEADKARAEMKKRFEEFRNREGRPDGAPGDKE
jgi:hypothetical protein